MITPIWRSHIGPLEERAGRTVVPDRVWEVEYEGRPITVIRSGVGAPNTGDVVLALGCSPCEAMVFTGSVGGLLPDMVVGDLVFVEKSLSADGFVRYLNDLPAAPDKFMSETMPDDSLGTLLARNAAAVSYRHGIPVHSGTVVSVDTIVGQFIRLSSWAAQRHLIGVEMETAATFEAARVCGIRVAALLHVSDVIPAKRTLFSGRTAEDHERRHMTRRGVLPEIILKTLAQIHV